jgi:inner membrane protein
MDNVTHAALGIAAGIVVRRRGGSISAAALTALLAAEAPDLDVFIHNADDPLVSFRWHRHFTHSFAFMPIWALLSAWVAAWFFRKRPDCRWQDLLLPGLVGALTHLLCDGCTSYGTMLLWPFTETRYSWDCLPIIDLLATLPLLALAILAWRKSSTRLAAYGLTWFISYALLGVWQHARAEAGLRTWLQGRKIEPSRLALKPTISNLIVWRGVWLHENQWQVAAVRVMPFAAPQISLGDKRVAWTPDKPGNPPVGSAGAQVLDDFSRFTQGWNTFTQDQGAILVGDIRFGMLPTSGRPLWTVRLEPTGQGPGSAKVIMDRALEPGDWSRFGRLLNGTDPNFTPIK